MRRGQLGRATLLEALNLCVQLALGIALPIWAIRWDMRRLQPARLARCWNDASLYSAVVAFGPLCLIVHFTRSRRTLVGFLLGLLWAAGTLLVLAVASLGFEQLQAWTLGQTAAPGIAHVS